MRRKFETSYYKKIHLFYRQNPRMQMASKRRVNVSDYLTGISRRKIRASYLKLLCSDLISIHMYMLDLCTVRQTNQIKQNHS